MNKFESLVINKAEEKINQEFRLKNIDVIKNYFIKDVKKKKKGIDKKGAPNFIGFWGMLNNNLF